MFNIALVDPEIPQNTGNIVRLCAACGANLHLVGKLGYDLDDAKLRRAGLDYWRSVIVGVHRDVDSLAKAQPGLRWLLFSKRGRIRYDNIRYSKEDLLVFGSESRGLPASLLEANEERTIYIPISAEVRSLNLAAAVHVALYEAWRQHDFKNFA